MKTGCILTFMVLTAAVRGQDGEAGLTFFESKIRPVLVAECYDCHNEKKAKGGLALDHRGGWQKGGDSGVVIVPGKPDSSLLIRSIRHEDANLKMPAKAPKLSEQTINDFVTWVRMGAPDPRDKAQPKVAEKKREWPEVMKERSHWWSFQPLAKSTLPDMPLHAAIDVLIQKKLSEARLSPAPRAAKPILARRLHYALTGLPPTPEEVQAFNEDTGPKAYAQRAETWLASPQFGEHWARHWMDVVHYSETHGSESDALIPFAWRYRDYLIRAFNDDLPYDQLVREHIAGDQIQRPRFNSKLGINESIIATAFWRFVEFYHTPVDVKREEVAVLDGQIDTFGKTFQALTLSCARCHDHKFDPIGNKDFYALYGILASTRTVMRTLDDPSLFVRPNIELNKLQLELRPALAVQWSQEITSWPEKIQAARSWLMSHSIPPAPAKPDPAKEKEIQANLPKDPWTLALVQAARQQDHPLAFLSQLVRCKDWPFLAKNQPTEPTGKFVTFADFRDGGLAGWALTGAGLPQQGEAKAGTLAIACNGSYDGTARTIHERGYHSDALSTLHSGSLRSPDFTIEQNTISVLARGESGARLRLVVENFQGDTVLFSGINPELKSESMKWYRLTIKPQWLGRRAYLEVFTRDDRTNVNNIKETETLTNRDGRSAFGIARVLFHSAEIRMAAPPALPPSFLETPSDSMEAAIKSLQFTVQASITRWTNNVCDDADARLLATLIENRLLDLPPAPGSTIATLAGKYRALEKTIPIAQRIPGVTDDHSGHDSAFFPRGDHTHPESLVPRRYLEVLQSNRISYANSSSGRLQLAEEVANPNNPLTARVMVNRVWHWLFGRGLVATVDNFGRMGAEPTHPELLDHLTREFIAHKWSLKYLIREIILSDTWQCSSLPSTAATELDAGNLLLSHANLRRLEAESVRDTLLAIAGSLDLKTFGPSIRTYYKTAIDSDKQPPSGPLDGNGRRSIYLEVRRNFLDNFLVAFDFPKPVATTGRRSETNVPAQSLALLNDPFVKQQAQVWAKRIRQRSTDPIHRVKRMYEEAFNREPDAAELTQSLSFIGPANDDAAAWTNFAHALMNMKEMVYLQ